MNAMTQTRPLPPAQQVRQQLEAMAPQFALALPPHVPAERFVRVVMTAVQSNPDLLEKDRQSLFESAMKCAQDGLLPDGREAALVIHGAKVTYMPMVAGILSKIRRSGELRSIAAHVVYENDHFDYALGDEEFIEHKPFIGDRGNPIITYAVAHTKDGGIYREVMTEQQVMAVKAISRARNGPWSGPFADEMRRKTAIRRLSKRLPMSTDLLAVIERDDEMYDLNKAQPVQVRRLHSGFEPDALPAPQEGFTSIHGVETNVEASTDFDAASPSEFASNQPASDAPPSSDAGDTFPGDVLPAGETTAGGPSASADDEKSPAVDLIAWAEGWIADFPFLTKEKLQALEGNRLELARFAQLQVQDLAKAEEFELALKTAREQFE